MMYWDLLHSQIDEKALLESKRLRTMRKKELG